MITPATAHKISSGSRAGLPILIATLLLAVLIGSGIALAQAEDAIPSMNLASGEPGQLVITWEAPEQAPTDYRIRWANTDLSWLSWKDTNEAERANEYLIAGITTITLNDLTPGDVYKVQMRSRYYNADRTARQKSGAWTSTATQKLMDNPPAPPTGLTASPVSHNTLTLTWADPQDPNITGYRILRGTDANSLSTIESNTESPITAYTDTTVAAETSYHYGVMALTQDGTGDQSATFNVTTPAEPQTEEIVQNDPPAKPTGLRASRTLHNNLTLTWDDPKDDTVTGYRILRGITHKNLPTIVDDTGNSSSSYTDNTVAQATAYFYQVAALRAGAEGPKSTTTEVNTPAASIRSVPGRSGQVSTETLISNMNRATPHMAYLISWDLAQKFHTGSDPADYKLSSVDLYLTGIGPDLTVKLFSGSPIGTEVATLTPEGWERLGHNVYTFVAPANTNLTANTDYWIVVKGTGNGWFKAAPSENVSPVPGWEIADTYDYRAKYIYEELEFRQFPGSLSIRINRLNNPSTGQPTIGGLPYVGEPLTALMTAVNDADGLSDPPDILTHQWKRHSADGATFELDVGTNSNTYTLVPGDEGKTIRVQIYFVDDAGNGEQTPDSAAHPSKGTVGPAAPPSFNLVSNTSQEGNTDVQISDQEHAQAFTTGGERNGYTLAKVNIVSQDSEEDDIELRVCEVDGSTHPTEICTDLIPPTLFETGLLVFSVPPHRTLRLEPDTTYSVVMKSLGGQDVRLDATESDTEDASSLGGWSIRNRSQFRNSNNEWEDRGYDRAVLIAVTGRLSPNEAPAGLPVITGISALGQTLSVSTDRITDPDGVPTNFTYEWQRHISNNTFEAVVGTDSPTYILTDDDVGKKIRVLVSYIDSQGYIEGPLASSRSAVIGPAPLLSNTFQAGKSIASVTNPISQAFTTGPETNGYRVSKVTIFYQDQDRQPVSIKICGTSGNGVPNQDCVNASAPRAFSSGWLNYTPTKGKPIQLDTNTTYAVQFEWPNAPQETDKYPPDIGITTGNGEDTQTADGWSIQNAFKQKNGSWHDSPREASIRMAIYAAVTPNSLPAGTPDITGRVRVGNILTASVDGITDTNGLPDTLTYQWKRHSADGAFEDDVGLDSDQYTLTQGDLGKKLTIQVSYTDRSNYEEGPLESETYPPGTQVIISDEDDLLVSNSGHPEQETLQAGSRVAQVFITGTNPNGYEITSVLAPGSNASVRICAFESQHMSSPPTDTQNCPSAPTPGGNPLQLRRDWLHAVVLNQGGTQATIGLAGIGQDIASLPHWSIRGKYQVQNQQGEWRSVTGNHAIRIELRGTLKSPFTGLGQLTATPANRQVTLTWRNWIPNNQDAIQKIQYRVKQADQPWNPDWTDINGSNDATEAHTIGNLTNGTPHTIEIRAVFDQDGQTVHSGSASVEATPRGPLAAPQNLDASTEGDGGVRLSWSDPADSTLTRYQYRYRNTSDNGWNPDWTGVPGSDAATTSHTLTGLDKNVRHTFEVRTLRGEQAGPASSSSVIPRGTLPRLRNLAAAADDRQVTLSWDHPGDHGITSYQYRHRAASETAWNPDWTGIPRSNADTTSFTVRPLVNITSYTLEVRALRGLEEGPAASDSFTTPDGPATVPNEPANLRVQQGDEGFNAAWGRPAEPDERAPVTGYQVRHRQIGTSAWQNVTVDCCGAVISGLRNRRHYETQVAAVNRLGTGPWTGPVNVTPQPPHTAAPGPTGDPGLTLGGLGIIWTNSDPDNEPDDACIGTRNFRIIWTGPDERARGADQWAAYIRTSGGAGEVTHSFGQSPGETDYYEMNGTVSFHGTGSVSIKLRGRFGQTWGTWSPTGSVYCFEQ